MVQLSFAAALLYGVDERKPAGLVPERANPARVAIVKNPFTGYPLTIDKRDIVNVVNGVAAVRMHVTPSGRFPTSKARRGKREFINQTTGNTLLVAQSAIIKEETTS